MPRVTESTVDEAALQWLGELGYTTLFGPAIAPDEPGAERASFDQAFLPGRLRASLRRINPADALDEAFRKVTLIDSPNLIDANHAFHSFLVEGVPVECLRQDGTPAHDLVHLVDFADPASNDWLAVSQFTVTQGRHNRRPDVVLFVNGLPLGVIELKNAADEEATIDTALRQLQTHKEQVPALFTCNQALVISDGLEARVGTLGADRERFMPWRTIEGEGEAPSRLTELEVLLSGLFEPRRFLDLVCFFVVFEADGARPPIKKMAGYHQIHAVQRAVETTVAASRRRGNRQAGVVWHTQGSGKSLTMAFYAGRIITEPAMENPTIVVLTDRLDLDDQLFGTFSRCQELLRQEPVPTNSRAELRSRRHLVQARSFAELLERSIRAYQNRAIEAAQVIEELIQLAKNLREADRRGEELGLGDDELAFYEALEVNDSAVKVLGDETLRAIARELVETVKQNVSIDWTVKESVRAKLRVMVKRVLRKHGYPPDKQEKATQTVLEQAELICEGRE